MKSKNYSAEIWNEIDAALATAVLEAKKTGQAPVAAFDADGTLWDTDLGEAFFKYQIEKNLLPEAFKACLPKDPWQHYRDWKKGGDPRPAYLWLAQINAGQNLQTVRGWAEAAVEASSPLPIFSDQKKLIEKFLQAGVEIYVVTASVGWAVEPGAKLLGIPAERVLGVQTRVENGIVTKDQAGEMTYREGKLRGLLAATGGRKPFFAAGNTMGDHALLSAARVSLAVGAAQPGQELFSTEEHLRTEARVRGWLSHFF